MHMVLADGNSLSLLPVVSIVRILWHLCIEKCSISQDQMSQGLIPAVLHFFICLPYWCTILFTNQYLMQLHTILDEMILGGQVIETSSEQIMKSVEEIARFYPMPSLHLLLALLCLILKTLSSLDTDWRNNQAQPASYPSRFQSVSVFHDWTFMVWSEPQKTRLALELTSSSLKIWIPWTQSLVIG